MRRALGRIARILGMGIKDNSVVGDKKSFDGMTTRAFATTTETEYTVAKGAAGGGGRAEEVSEVIADFSKLSPEKTVSACLMQNGKPFQQDRVIVGKTDFDKKNPQEFYKETLPRIIESHSKGHKDSGATLITVAVTPGKEEGSLPTLTTAHLGDSCAALVVGFRKADGTIEFSTTLLTKPHNLDHPAVIKELEKEGIDPDSIEEDERGEKRIMGLAMGAAIGHEDKPLLRTPEVIQHDLNNLKYLPQYSEAAGKIEYLKLVVASDGVYIEGMCGREVTFDEDGRMRLETIRKLLPTAPFSKEIAEAHEKKVTNTSEFLAIEAIDRGSTDNISVSIVNLMLFAEMKGPDDHSTVIMISDGNGRDGHIVSDAVTRGFFKEAKMIAIPGMEEATPIPDQKFKVRKKEAEKLSAEELAAAISERS